MGTFNDACDIATGIWVGVFLADGGEAEVAADHLQQPNTPRRVGDAAPASGSPVEHGEQQ